MLKTKKAVSDLLTAFFVSDPGEARTLDPMIKSHLLYQLSYGVIPLISDAKVMPFVESDKYFCNKNLG